jgi:hypothetical protein
MSKVGMSDKDISARASLCFAVMSPNIDLTCSGISPFSWPAYISAKVNKILPAENEDIKNFLCQAAVTQ